VVVVIESIHVRLCLFRKMEGSGAVTIHVETDDGNYDFEAAPDDDVHDTVSKALGVNPGITGGDGCCSRKR